MAPLFNTTIVCNTTATCASALDKVQERYEDFERLSYILGALLGIVFLLFICSPLIFNLPKERDNDDYESRRAPPSSYPAYPPPPDNDGVELQDLGEAREMPSPEQFVIGEESANSTQSSLPDPSRFRQVKVDGESFHINKSDATLLEETGVFRGAGDERELARGCVDETRAPSTVGDGEYEGTSRGERIGTAV